MTKMTVNAVAIWNEETGNWEVKIDECYESDTQFADGKYHKIEKTSVQNISNCDEYVIAWASLKHNGIDTEKIDEILDNYY